MITIKTMILDNVEVTITKMMLKMMKLIKMLLP